MMTGSVPNEGKSFLTIQLWRQMTRVRIPVLLIDYDFCNSEMQRKYGIRSAGHERPMGTAHYPAGKATAQNVIYKPNIPNGYMIPVASTIANPMILLGMVLNQADTGSRSGAFCQRYYGSSDYGYGRSRVQNTSSNGGMQT